MTRKAHAQGAPAQAGHENDPPAAGAPAVTGVRRVQEWSIDGFGAVYDRLGPSSDEGAIVVALREHADESGIPLPGGRSVGNAFRLVVDILRGRRLLRDWGEYPAAVDWLTLHVPPGGAAAFTLQNRAIENAGVTLKLLGSGYGGGRGVILAVKEDFRERTQCTRLTQHVTVRVRTFDGGRGPDDPDVETSVVTIRHLEVRPWNTCPLCGTNPDAVDITAYEPAGPGLDLIHDDVGQTQQVTIQLSATDRGELKLPVQIPGLSQVADIGLFAERQLELTCSSEYRFPPRAFFAPFRPFGTQADLPFWTVRR
jgi:hypothetical protein